MTHRSMFEGGHGLPLMAIGWSAIISLAGFWAWLETANLWAVLAYSIPRGFGFGAGLPAADIPRLSEGFVGYFLMAGFALLGQWTANFAILRLRRGASRLLWCSYGIAALVAAVSLHHVYEVQAAPGWRAQVEARAEAREPDDRIITENRAFLRQVQERTMNLNTDTYASRNESVSGPLLAEAQRAERAIAAAEARLTELPALPSERPKDFGDVIAVLLALLLAAIEFTLNWGIGGRTALIEPKGTPGDADTAKGDEADKPQGDVVQFRPGAKDIPTPQIVPDVVKVGAISFERATCGRELLDELEKAGLIDRRAVWSKVNSYPRASRKAAA